MGAFLFATAIALIYKTKMQQFDNNIQPLGLLTPEQRQQLTTLKTVLLPAMSREALEALAFHQARRTLEMGNFQEWMVQSAVNPVSVPVDEAEA